MSEEHEHHSHPSRCCASEDARDVIARLRANPPRRLGYQTKQGWSGEGEAQFAQRQAAWEQAVAREEAAMKEEAR